MIDTPPKWLSVSARWAHAIARIGSWFYFIVLDANRGPIPTSTRG
jgi:uncharacterized membrane protein